MVEGSSAAWKHVHVQPLGKVQPLGNNTSTAALLAAFNRVHREQRVYCYEPSTPVLRNRPHRLQETGYGTYLRRHLVRDSWRLGAVVQGLPVLPREHEGGLPKDENLVTVQVAVRTEIGRRARALQETQGHI